MKIFEFERTEETRKRCRQETRDIILPNLVQPDKNRLKFVSYLREHLNNRKSIMLRLTADEDNANFVNAIAKYVQDYFPKNKLTDKALYLSVHHHLVELIWLTQQSPKGRRNLTKPVKFKQLVITIQKLLLDGEGIN